MPGYRVKKELYIKNIIFTLFYLNQQNIIALTDLHGRTGVFRPLAEKIKQADLIILSGDITHFGNSVETARIISKLSDLNQNIIAVTGNCDRPDCEQYLADKGLSAFGQTREFGGIHFFGISGSLPCPGRTPNEYSEQEYDALLSDVMFPKGQPVILISHQPPFNTLNDAVAAHSHVGSRSIRNFISRVKPLICLTDIPEGTGIDFIENRPLPPGARIYRCLHLRLVRGKLKKSLKSKLSHEALEVNPISRRRDMTAMY
jgi:Icc-related predicted phosphoesterase